jgi:hypothetical protein
VLMSDYSWIVCRGADGEVMGAVGMPVLDMSEEAVEARAHRRRAWLAARYPGPATGRDPEAVRLVAERKRKGGSYG